MPNSKGNFINGNPAAREDHMGTDSNVFVGYFPQGILVADPDPTPKISLGATYHGVSLGPTTYPLRDFLIRLGITLEDVAKALYGGNADEKT
jgi:hypothetical protein